MVTRYVSSVSPREDYLPVNVSFVLFYVLFMCLLFYTLWGFIVILRQGLRLGLWQACLELMPPSPLKYWDYGLAPSCPAESNTLSNLVSLLFQIQINGQKAGHRSLSKTWGEERNFQDKEQEES